MITKKSGRGRQRGTGLPMETLIHMKVTREMYDESKAVATANCLPLTGWIRQVLLAALARARRKNAA